MRALREAISRARTLDDPLTTRVLAEVTRGEAASEDEARALQPQRASTHGETEKDAPRTTSLPRK